MCALKNLRNACPEWNEKYPVPKTADEKYKKPAAEAVPSSVQCSEKDTSLECPQFIDVNDVCVEHYEWSAKYCCNACY